jgi:hypothetical protein
MENQASATKTMLTYGLYLGIVSIIVSVANYSFGNIYKPHWSINIINYLLMIGFIALGLKAFKDQNGGYLKLAEAIKIGMGIALVAGILSLIYFLIFVKVIEPDFISKLGEVQEQMMYERFPDMDEAILEKQVEMSKKFMTPGVMSAFILGGSLFLGLIFSLIIGLIMKKTEE